MRRKRWVLNLTLLALIVLWGSLLSLLLRRERPPSQQVVVPAQPVSHLGREEWMGVYMNDSKVGWVVSRTDELQDGYHIVERTNLTLKVMGTEQTVKSLVDCYADTSYVLRRLSFEFSSGEYLLKLRGEMEGTSLKYELISGNDTVQSELSLSEETYIPVSIEAVASKMGLAEGRMDSFDIFEPTTATLAKVRVMVEGEEEILLEGQSHRATRVAISLLGTRSRVWLDADGSVLREESPLGLTMLRERREEALKEEAVSKGVEILTLYAIPSNVNIPNPRKTSELKLRLTGAELEELELKDERQELRGDTLLVSALPPSLKGAYAIDLQEFEEDLSPTPLMQSQDKRIQALVESVVTSQDVPATKANKLLTWVYENLEKRPTISIPSAVEVLRRREGDCNEHAVLFVALARAAGIPARVCAGLVFMNGGFYYHAWSKVWVGEWTSVDPVLGQSVADATHIKLAEGGMADILDLVRVIGRLKIEVLEYR